MICYIKLSARCDNLRSEAAGRKNSHCGARRGSGAAGQQATKTKTHSAWKVTAGPEIKDLPARHAAAPGKSTAGTEEN